MFREAIKLTNQRLEFLKQELEEIKEETNKKIEDKKQEITNIQQAIDGLWKIQSEYDREKGNLATQKGICPFPNNCDERNRCTLNSCNADTCDNGYAFRWS